MTSNSLEGPLEFSGAERRSVTQLRLAFLIKALGAGPGGGAERILTLVANELAERGHEVTVLSFDAPDDRDFYKVSSKIRRLPLGLGRTTGRSDISTTARRLVAVRHAIRQLDPDVAIGFMHSAFVPLSLGLCGTGVAVIGSERTSFAHYRTRPLQRVLLRASLPFLDALTVNGEEVRQGFPRAVAAKMVVLSNPVLRATGLADTIGGDIKTLLCVGGLRQEKDHRTLLLAFAALAHEFPDWRLRIVGDGPLRGSLRRTIERLSIGDRVELVGAVSSVETEYRSAQLFVLPSTYEAFPNCIGEALAHGLPAVGFADCPGTNTLILHDVNGVLAAGSDRVRTLGTSLARLMASPSLRQAFATKAPSTVQHYSLPEIVDQWEQLLHEVARVQLSKNTHVPPNAREAARVSGHSNAP